MSCFLHADIETLVDVETGTGSVSGVVKVNNSFVLVTKLKFIFSKLSTLIVHNFTLTDIFGVFSHLIFTAATVLPLA